MNMAQNSMPSKSVKAPQLPSEHVRELLTIDRLDDEVTYSNFTLTDFDLSDQSAAFVTWEQGLLGHGSLRSSSLRSLKLLDVRVERCDLSNLQLEKAVFSRVEFVGCRWTGLKAQKARFSNVRIDSCKCDLAQLFGSSFESVQFENCQFAQADLRESNLQGAVFSNCDLRDAELYGANLEKADLRGSQIEGLKLHPEDWRGAIIDSQQLITLANDFAKIFKLRVEDSTR
jgi:uncharacterized protein YjbI with pentapeptide repeats